MKNNVSFKDKVIRIVASFIFAALYLTGIVPGIPGLLLLVLGIIFVGTSLFSFCPIYSLLGLSTIKEHKA